MVTLEGFEPPTHSLEGCCSIQLSYKAIIYKIVLFTFYFKNKLKKLYFH